MSESNHRWRRKCCILALFALVIGLMGLTLPEQSILYNNYTNITYGVGGGVSFNGSPVDLNGSILYNGTIANYSTLAYLNVSLSSKVNKTGDNMTGFLGIQGMKVGDFRNYTQQGFDFNSSYFQGMYSAYNDTLCMYTGNAVNAYFDGQFTATQGWHKLFKNQDSIIIQSKSCNPLLYDVPASVDVYASARTSADPFLNFDLLFSYDNRSYSINKNMTAYDNITVKKKLSLNLTVNGASDYLCIYANQTIFTSNTASC